MKCCEFNDAFITLFGAALVSDGIGIAFSHFNDDRYEPDEVPWQAMGAAMRYTGQAAWTSYERLRDHFEAVAKGDSTPGI